MQVGDRAEVGRPVGTRHHRRPQFLPGAEAAALAGQQQRAAGAIRLGIVQRGEQRRQHRLVRRVQLVRPVQHQLAPALAPSRCGPRRSCLPPPFRPRHPPQFRPRRFVQHADELQRMAVGIVEIHARRRHPAEHDRFLDRRAIAGSRGVRPARRSAATDSNTCGSSTSNAMCSRIRSGDVPIDHRPSIALSDDGTQKNATCRAAMRCASGSPSTSR